MAMPAGLAKWHAAHPKAAKKAAKKGGKKRTTKRKK